MKRATKIIWTSAALLCGLLAGCQTNGWHASAPVFPGAHDEVSRQAQAYAHFSLGIVREVNGDAPAAWEEFYQAARLDRHDPDLLAEVAKRLIEGRQFQPALEVLQWATKIPPVDGTVYLRLGFVHAQLGHKRKAIQANRLAVERLPGFLPAWHNLYLSYAQNQQPKEALTALDEAARQPGLSAEDRIALAELYATCGRQFNSLREVTGRQAVALLDQALADNSLLGLARLKLADGFYLFGENDKAARLYLEFLAHGEPASPLRDILRAKLTEIYLRNKEPERAREQLLAILHENPANAGAHYFLGALAMESHQWAAAAESFQRALTINPGFDAARLDLAAAQIAGGDAAAARRGLTEWERQKPLGFSGEYLTGLAYYLEEKFPEALPHFTAAESLARAGDTNRLDSAFYFQFGAASERVGRRTDAARYFERAITLAPDNADAWNYLGYMWAEQGENLPRAREHIERALKLQPNNEAFLDSMGWVLYKLGKAQEALPYLEQAVARSQEPDATVYDHLGDVFAALNEMDKAREAWAKSLAIVPNEAVQRKLNATGNKLPP